MSAVATFPHLHFALLKYFLHLNILEQCTVSLLVVLLNLAYEAESGCELREALLLSCLSKALIGQNQFFDNAGGMRNRGIDFTFSSVVYRSENQDLSIRPYFNVNYNKQEVTALFGNKTSNVIPS